LTCEQNVLNRAKQVTVKSAGFVPSVSFLRPKLLKCYPEVSRREMDLKIS
jgi:hypothetical protein